MFCGIVKYRVMYLNRFVFSIIKLIAYYAVSQ
nr:MAG TPA: hypothetical protein [Caudoviricetes sp.]